MAMDNRQLTFLYLSAYGQLSAAADEQRALHILQGSARYVTVKCQKVLPNLKVNLRDQTNATTRWPHKVNKHDVAHSVGQDKSTQWRIYDHVFSPLLDGLRRLPTTPWLADLSWSDTMKKLISGKTSIAKLIAYSENFRAVFNGCARVNTESVLNIVSNRHIDHWADLS